MKFSYKFSNLLGTVYHKGNLVFTNNGNTVISPVGNRVSLFDLKNNKSETLPIESRVNICNVAVSPCGNILIAINEDGDALVCSLISKTVLARHRFIRKIHDICFSPNGKYIAMAKGDAVFTYNAPSATMRCMNVFSRVHVLRGFHDDAVCLSWTSDSRVLAAGANDASTRVAAIAKFKNIGFVSLGGHQDAIVGCFFEENSLDLYTVARNGAVNVWECNLGLEDLIPLEEDCEKQQMGPMEEERDSGNDGSEVKSAESLLRIENVDSSDSGKMVTEKIDKAIYKKIERHYPRKAVKGDGFVTLTAAAFHKKTHILITGFSNGAFFLHEMPSFSLIHSLSIAEQVISTVSFNSTGDWIAIACGGLGQLIVWEWQSETYILKQQGHFNNMKCLTYSPDGQYLATGGEDGKVKLWNLSTGFCFVTFADHTSSISGIAYTQNGKAIVSASLDGTVRAFDLARYRNFRTFTSPRPTQFASLAVDPSGEVVCAGGQDNFEIYVWSMQNGRLLEVLSGHEAPVNSLTFSSIESILVSGSWDKTFKIWDVFSGKGSRETINLTSDVLAVVFRPDGAEIAASTLNGQINFFDVESATQVGSIEGRNDLGSGRRETDLVTAKQILKTKAFTSLCYTADGQCILAAGQSKNICIYHVREQILLKKFEITQNRSFDAMDDFCSRRKMSEFGNLALVEERDPDYGNTVSIALPGVKKGDMAARAFKPEVSVTSVRFSPTGRSWAAATTEGLLVYSLDHNLVFDPLELEKDVTVASVRATLYKKDFSKALMMALKLNEQKLVAEVFESIKTEEIGLVLAFLSGKYLERLITFMADQLESSNHLEFYLLWIQTLLMTHGQELKDRSMHILSILHNLQRTLYLKQQSLEKICDHNKFSLQYIISLGQVKKRKTSHHEEDSDSDSGMMDFQSEGSSES